MGSVSVLNPVVSLYCQFPSSNLIANYYERQLRKYYELAFSIEVVFQLDLIITDQFLPRDPWT